MKLSVIVPVLNSMGNLPKLFDSILMQSEQDIEIICVDMGSDDGSDKLIEEYDGGTGGRVRLVRLETTEQIDSELLKNMALNEGIRQAKGEYLHFLKTRDEVLPHAYEVILDKAKRGDYDCLRFRGYLYDTVSGDIMAMPEFSLDDTPEGMFRRVYDFSAKSPRFMRIPEESVLIIKRSFLIENQIFFDETITAGFRMFLTRLILTAKRFSACRDRVVLSGLVREYSFYNGNIATLSNMLKTLDLIDKELEKYPELTKEVRIKILINEFEGVCNYFQKAVKNLENRELFLSVIYKYIDGKDPALHRYYSDRLKEAIRTVDNNYGGQNIRKANIFGEPYPRPKVSVIIPIYNQERYLNQALDTLGAQSLKQIEIIAVNDGSTDISGAILNEYAALDKRIRVIDKENTGYGHSVNVGMDAAKGEYIGILEPDDFVPTNMYEDLYIAATGYGAQIVRSDFYWYKELSDGSHKKRYKRLTGEENLYNRVLNPRKEPGAFDVVMNTWTGIYQREFLNKYRLRHNESPGAAYQDNGFFFTAMCKTDSVLMLNRPYYFHRLDVSSLSVATDDEKMYCVTNEFRHVKEWMEKNPDTLMFKSQYEALRFRNFIYTYRRTSDAMRPEYLRHIRNEFKAPLSDGLLTPANLPGWQYKTLEEIVRDPEGYFDKIRVSVCMTYKDDKDRIEDFVKSSIGPNVMRMELLCINIGSTDGTASILRQMAQKDDRIKLIDGVYSNAAAGFNVAITSARGQYLVPISMEFEYEPDYILSLTSRAYERDADVCCASGKGRSSVGSVPHEGALYGIGGDLFPVKDVFSHEDLIEDGIRAVGLCFFDKAFSMRFIEEKNLKMRLTLKYFTQDFTARALKSSDAITVRSSVRLSYPDMVDSFFDPDVFLDEMYEALEIIHADKRTKKNFANYALYRIGIGLLLCDTDFNKLYDDIRFQRLAVYGIDDLEEDEIIDRSFIETWNYIKGYGPEEYLDRIRRNYFMSMITIRSGSSRAENAQTAQKRLRERIREVKRLEKKTENVISGMENSRTWKMMEPLRKLKKKFK